MKKKSNRRIPKDLPGTPVCAGCGQLIRGEVVKLPIKPSMFLKASVQPFHKACAKGGM